MLPQALERFQRVTDAVWAHSNETAAQRKAADDLDVSESYISRTMREIRESGENIVPTGLAFEGHFDLRTELKKREKARFALRDEIAKATKLSPKEQRARRDRPMYQLTLDTLWKHRNEPSPFMATMETLRLKSSTLSTRIAAMRKIPNLKPTGWRESTPFVLDEEIPNLTFQSRFEMRQRIENAPTGTRSGWSEQQLSALEAFLVENDDDRETAAIIFGICDNTEYSLADIDNAVLDAAEQQTRTLPVKKQSTSLTRELS